MVFFTSRPLIFYVLEVPLRQNLHIQVNLIFLSWSRSMKKNPKPIKLNLSEASNKKKDEKPQIHELIIRPRYILFGKITIKILRLFLTSLSWLLRMPFSTDYYYCLCYELYTQRLPSESSQKHFCCFFSP